MKKILPIILLFSNTAFSQTFSDVVISNGSNYPYVDNPVSKPGYLLIFNDEFEYQNPNPGMNFNIWEQENNSMGANNLACYVDEPNHNGTNYEYTRNTVKLIAKQEPPPPEMTDSKRDYTSACFKSIRTFKYGYFEMKCKLPGSSPSHAFCPAFWLYGDQYDEIDIMETYGDELSKNYMNYLWKGTLDYGQWCDGANPEWCSNQKNFSISGDDFSEEFYTFGLDWSPDKLEFYLNNVLVRTVKYDCNIPNTFSKILANLAVLANYPLNENYFPAVFEIDYIRVYKKIEVEDFGFDAGGWNKNLHVRTLADVTGDGKEDIIGFGGAGVYVSKAIDFGFTTPHLWIDNFGSDVMAGSWEISKHPRMMADVNNDGKDDIIGFGGAGVYVSLAKPSMNGFAPQSLWLRNFGYDFAAGSWRNEYHIRTAADINNDGYNDIVGFGGAGMYVALGTGSQFNEPSLMVADHFGSDITAGAWDVINHPRMIADVNGDNFPDAVGFYSDGVQVALSNNGTSFDSPQLMISGSYGSDISAGGWDPSIHIRTMSDVNGDGMSDVVGFYNDGVHVALSTGNSFNDLGLVLADFDAQNWSPQNPRMMGDINGDGKDDIVAFGQEGVFISLAYVDPNGIFGFLEVTKDLDFYGNNTEAGEWNENKTIRTLADINGDGRKDIVGFGKKGVFTTAARNCSDVDVYYNAYRKTHIDGDTKNEAGIKIYPNPGNGIIQIESESQIKQITIVNSLGEKKYFRDATDVLNLQIDLTSFANGIYLFILDTDKGSVTRKFVKE